MKTVSVNGNYKLFKMGGGGGGAPCTICNVLHGWSRKQKKEKQNHDPNPKNNSAAGYQGPVKIELLKGAGLLFNGPVNTCVKTRPGLPNSISHSLG